MKQRTPALFLRPAALLLALLLLGAVAAWSQTPPTTTPPGTTPPTTIPPTTIPSMTLPPPAPLPSLPTPLVPGVAPATQPPLMLMPTPPTLPPAVALPTTPPDPFTVILPVFGQSVFSAAASPAAGPIQAAAATDAYVLGPGDIVRLRLMTGGTLQASGDLPVDPEGNLYLDNIGRVGVQGSTLAGVRTMLQQRYARLFKDFTLEITISQMRTVDVFVIGEVVRPGKYTLPGNATVFTALFSAGGPSNTGSLRNIRLTRADQSLQTIDLYDYLLQGQRVVDVPLQPSDTIFIPVVGPLVGVAGSVKRPARYELKGTQNLEQVLTMAGGLLAQAFAPRLQVRRYAANRTFQTLDIDQSQPGLATAFLLQDGDRVVAEDVTYQLTNNVELVGAVYRPGIYQLRPGLTLGALLRDAEGLQPTAYTSWGTLRRVNTQTAQYEESMFDPLGAVQGQAGKDVPLQARDQVIIYNDSDIRGPLQVTVNGHVRHAGPVPYTFNMTIKDAVLTAGGLLPDALMSRALLLRVRPDMEREVLTVAVDKAMAGDPQQNLVLLPNDRLTIYARSDIGPLPTVNIAGQILNPGLFPRQAGLMISQLVIAAGGITPGANGVIKVTHGRYTDHPEVETVTFIPGDSLPDVKPDLTLRDDDFVAVMGSAEFVQAPQTVQILGQVSTPGPYALVNPAAHPEGVWEVLKRSGGLLPTAYGPGIVVYRRATGMLNAHQQTQYAQVVGNIDEQSLHLHLEGAYPPAPGANVIGAATTPVPSALDTGPPATPPAAPAPAPVAPAPAPTTSTGASTAYTPTPGAPTSTLAGGSVTAATPGSVPAATPGSVTAASPTVSPTPAPSTSAVPPPAGVSPAVQQQVTLGLAQALTTQNAVTVVVPPRNLSGTVFASAVPIDWHRLQASQGKQGDVVLQDGDVVYIPTTPTTVLVAGAVQVQGAIRYQPGMRIRDALDQAGGLGKDAVLHSAIVIRANGQTLHVNTKDAVQPGDIIIVPTQYIIQKAGSQSAIERILSALANAAIIFKVGGF